MGKISDIMHSTIQWDTPQNYVGGIHQKLFPLYMVSPGHYVI